MKRPLLSFSLAVLLATPLAAQVHRVENRVDVTPTSGGFLIQNGGGMGARGMWCGAADYARSVLGASGAQRIYVTGPRTSGNRRAPVKFSLDPSGTTPTSATILGSSIRTPGANLSLNHALSFCADFRLTNN